VTNAQLTQNIKTASSTPAPLTAWRQEALGRARPRDGHGHALFGYKVRLPAGIVAYGVRLTPVPP
jgi:hypothetical protein